MNRIYRALLRAYPAEFRKEYGAEMERLFQDRLGSEPRARVWAEALWDVLLTAPRERLDVLRADVRQARREFLKNPGFAATAMVSLALGIGATTVVFSVIYGVLIDPYPYRDSGRMVQFDLESQPHGANRLFLSWPQYEQFRSLDVLDGAIAMDNFDTTTTSSEGLAEAVRTARISSNAFEYFGVQAALGRGFSAADAPHVAVLSDRFWRQRYSARTDVIGKVLRLDREDYTIIGVVPPRFRWGPSEVYVPLRPQPGAAYEIHARIGPGVSRDRAEAGVENLLRGFARETPERFSPQVRAHAVSLNGARVGSFAATLLMLFAAVGALLAVGCANVSILLLARGAARQYELSIRSALGASRGRIASQLLTESVVLSLAGGVLGVLLAVEGMNAVTRWLPRTAFPPEADIHLSLPVLVFSTGLAVLTGILFGLAPAIQFSRAPNRAGAVRAGRRTHNVLVAAQVALTMVLLAGAGTAARSLISLYRTRLGYDPRHVMSVVVPLPEGSYSSYGDRVTFYERIRAQVAALPQIEAATLAMAPYPPMSQWRQRVEIGGGSQVVSFQETTSDYFSALKIPVVQGRPWSAEELAGAARVAMINQEMARRYWPGQNPIGRTVRLLDLGRAAWNVPAPGENAVEIIGVVGDTPNNGLREAVSPALYAPYTLEVGDSLLLIVRTRSDSSGTVRAIREAIRSVDPNQPVTQLETAENWLSSNGWEREQFIAAVFSAFAVVALALAAVGLYSVISYATALRAREFGVRMALGALPRHVIGMVMASAGRITAIGAAAGVALSLIFYGAAMLAPVTVVLLAAAALAAYLPARRAAKSDPVAALRD